MLNFSTRPDKVEELIQLIAGDEEARDVVRTIDFQDTFSFTYDVRRSADVNTDYLDPGHDVDDFRSDATVANRISNPVAQLQSFQKGRRRKGGLIPTVGSIAR